MRVLTGVDVVDLARFEAILARTPHFLRRVFTVDEIELSCGRPASLAGRFAAKEAALKAMGKPLFSVPFKEIVVVNAPSGQPVLYFTGVARELTNGWVDCSVSISHSDLVAIATVVALSDN
jgi:holo-[acyl-carrier protein] synthase